MLIRLSFQPIRGALLKFTNFQCLDKDADGKLSFEDISNSLKKYFGGNEENFQMLRIKDFLFNQNNDRTRAHDRD